MPGTSPQVRDLHLTKPRRHAVRMSRYHHRGIRRLAILVSIPALFGLTLFQRQNRIINRSRSRSSTTPQSKPTTNHSTVPTPPTLVSALISTLVANSTQLPGNSTEPVEVCQQSQCTPFQQLDPMENQFRDLHQLFTGNGIISSFNVNSTSRSSIRGPRPSNDYSVCMFHNRSIFYFHFPHTMAQIYRCWSWWRIRRSHVPDETPVLVFPTSAMPNNAFLEGFIASLQATIGLKLWTPLDFQQTQEQRVLSHVVRPRVPDTWYNPINTFGMKDRTRPYFALHQVDDARQLRDTILFGRPDEAALETELCGGGGTTPKKPRLAILNRRRSRSWLNAEAVASRLQPYAANGEVPVVFFENKTFVEQISFFRNVDVLVSPHGAQLTGLPFLSDCGAVLEIFPKGYYFPYYFGSLALASSLQHGYVSITSGGSWRDEAAQGMKIWRNRKWFREQSVCPNVDVIVDSVVKLISQWEACCQGSAEKTRS